MLILGWLVSETTTYVSVYDLFFGYLCQVLFQILFIPKVTNSVIKLIHYAYACEVSRKGNWSGLALDVKWLGNWINLYACGSDTRVASFRFILSLGLVYRFHLMGCLF